jgi:hypothetical protein
MSLYIGTQNVVLNLMTVQGAIASSVVLPPCNKKGGISFKWQNTGVVYKQPNGVPIMVYSDATSKFVPILTLRWDIYDTTGVSFTNPNGFGTGNGQTPTLDQLVSLLGVYSPYLLQAQAGPGYGVFDCFVSRDITLNPLGGLVYADVTLELTGSAGFPTMQC